MRGGKLSRGESQINKYTIKQLKSAEKNKAETLLRLNKKNSEEEELPHELFLATRQTTKIKNSFANNMSADIKLSKAQMPKIIQTSGSYGFWLGNLVKKALTNIAITLATDNLRKLVSNLHSSAIKKFDRKISGKGSVRPGKRFTLIISSEDINDIIRIIKSSEDSGL